jgi:F-box interacting protein
MESQELSIKANKVFMEEEEENQGTTTTTTTSDRCNFAELPWHVILEIMLKLPIEALIRCRYVCKAWHDLLLDPSFAKLHHGSTPTGFVLQSSLFPHGNSGALYLIEPQEQEPSSIIAKFNQFPYLESTLVNSCNGLICSCDIRMANPIYISNPVMGEFLTLPKGETNPDRQFVSGFGFSAKTKQYKVIKYSEFVEIYTLGTGAWKRSERVPPARHRSLFGTFVNGALHWLVKLPNSSVLIRCFDLENEKFQTIPLPSSTFYHASFERSSLGILGDCLCLSSVVASASSDWDIHVWVMKEYGVRESWIKEAAIKYPSPWEYWWSPECVKVISFLKNREVVLDCAGCLVIYDVEQESFRLLKPNGILLTHVNATAHATSFVSLKDIAKGDDGSKVLKF